MWGQALVDAYKIENEISKYPRIVFDKNGLLIQYIDKMKNDFRKTFINSDDNDKELFVNYLNKTSYLIYEYLDEILTPDKTRIKQFINSNIETLTDEKALAKWQWVRDYYNRTLGESYERI